MAKILGHNLNPTQERAAVVSAAVGIALLAVAVMSMRRGSTQGASSDALNVAYKQGFNAGATDADLARDPRSVDPTGSWSSTPEPSTSAPLSPFIAPSSSFSSFSSAPATTQEVRAAGPITWAPWVTASRSSAPAPAPAPVVASAPRSLAVIPAGPISWKTGFGPTWGGAVTAEPTPAPSRPGSVVRDPENPYWSGYNPLQSVAPSGGGGGGGEAVSGPMFTA